MDHELAGQLDGQVQHGIPRVKLKIGSTAPQNLARERADRRRTGAL